jgi:hypothetical protein
MSVATPKLRFALFFGINLLFLLVLALAYLVGGGASNPRWLYLVLLCAICSTSLIDLDGLNGRYSLLAIFLLAYFIYFGVGDLSNIAYGGVTELQASVLSRTEAVILLGGALLIIGYRIAVSIGNRPRDQSPPRDWSPRAIPPIGLALWLIGTYAIYRWYVYIVTDVTLETTHAGLAKLGPIATVGYLLAQMMQPLGVLLIVYAWRVNRRWYLAPLVVGIVTLQLVLGFVVDIKGVAMLGGILVIVTSALVDGRVAKSWLVGAALFIFIAFPVFQAHRELAEGNRGIARTTVVENLVDTLRLAIAAKGKVTTGRNRAQTFFERVSLKSSIQMIVDKTGNEVAFQRGYTLMPILETFLPRVLWSDKPDIPTGQIVNRVFHVTEQDETYISPSHLGELYWNFGWAGVVVGMTAIGFLCGLVGRFNLAEARTVTRLLVSVLTIRYVINGFEGSLASSYVVWLRSLAAVGLLHLAFARVPITLRRSGPTKSEEPHSPGRLSDDLKGEARVFPNLLS